MNTIRPLLLLVASMLPAGQLHASDNIDLISLMKSFQYFAHKTGLAIDHKNRELTSFYAHEIEETLKEVMKVKSFDGHSIGTLAKSVLKPAHEDLEKAIKSGSWEAVSNQFDAMLDACNRCHKTTDHIYIRIQRQHHNPYMQSFAPVN